MSSTYGTYSENEAKNMTSPLYTSQADQKPVSDSSRHADSPLAQKTAAVVAKLKDQKELPEVRLRNEKIRLLKDVGVGILVSAYSYFSVKMLLKGDFMRNFILQCFFLATGALVAHGLVILDKKLNEEESKLK